MRRILIGAAATAFLATLGCGGKITAVPAKPASPAPASPTATEMPAAAQKPAVRDPAPGLPMPAATGTGAAPAEVVDAAPWRNAKVGDWIVYRRTEGQDISYYKHVVKKVGRDGVEYAFFECDEDGTRIGEHERTAREAMGGAGQARGAERLTAGGKDLPCAIYEIDSARIWVSVDVPASGIARRRQKDGVEAIAVKWGR